MNTTTTRTNRSSLRIASARRAAASLGAPSWQVRAVSADEAGADGFAVERTRGGGVVTDRAWVFPALHPAASVDALIALAKAGIESAAA